MGSTMNLFTAFLITIGPMAIGVTKAVDLVRNAIDKAGTKPKVIWNILAFVFGIALAVLFHYDFAEALVHSVPALSTTNIAGLAGEILTGIGIGGMAGFWHEPLSSWGTKSGSTVA